MFPFSLEMQMVSKCLRVYLVNHSQASMSPSPLLLSPKHENMRSGLPSGVDQTSLSALGGRGVVVGGRQEEGSPNLPAPLLLLSARHAGPTLCQTVIHGGRNIHMTSYTLSKS